MNLNLSQFKKVKDDKTTAVLQHPSGHKIEISKNSLNPKHMKDLEKLPLHMEQGGMVPQNQNPQQPTIVINNGPQQPQYGQPPFAMQSPQVAQQQAQWPDPQSYLNHMGDVDLRKMAIASPDASPEAKLKAVQDMAQQENVAAKVKEREMLAKYEKQKAEHDAAVQYNQMAAQRGLPPAQVPSMPQQPNIPGTQVASLSTSGLMGQDQGLAAQPAPQAPTDPYGTEAYYNAINQGLSQQKQGLQQEAMALGQQGKQEARILEQAYAQQQQKAQSFQENFANLEKERQAFVTDLENKHIDPDRYMNNMSTGKHLRTMIGLILGGFSTQSGHQNPVMNYLKQQIENDIKSQEADIGKGKSLLEANYRQFGNMRDAADMTRVMMNDMVVNQLKQAAAQTQDPIAKARAMQKIGEITQQSAPILSQIAMRKTLLGGMQSGASNPGMVIRMLVPDGQQQAAYKELGEAQEMVKARDAILSGFEKVAKLNTLGSRIGSPIQSGEQIEAMINPILMELAKDTAGKFSEMEYNELKPLMPRLLDDEKTMALKKQKLLSMVQKKMNTPILSSYGINLGNVQPGNRYGSDGEKKIKLGAPVIANRGE